MLRPIRFEWAFITLLVVLIAFASSVTASNTDTTIGFIVEASVETQETEGETYLSITNSVVVNTSKFSSFHPNPPPKPWVKTPFPYHAQAPPLV